jgi:wyosine [tRNA(Phe)-imidazoG37] synthetase (radical SAM superfamily)
MAAGVAPDYITLAGSGEPTLNARIGDLIGKVQGLTDIPVAVLTNGSLLWMSEVQDALMAADLVLPSLDAGDERLFRYVNRPHGDLSFERIVDGIADFIKRCPGQVWLEVLLLAGVTGIPSEAKKIAALAKRIGPARVQLSTVSRPPAEEFALPLSTDQMLALKNIFPGEVDIISESERDGERVSAFSEAREADILAVLRRRPCTSADVASGLGIHGNEALKRLEALVAAGKVNTVVTSGQSFYTAKG